MILILNKHLILLCILKPTFFRWVKFVQINNFWYRFLRRVVRTAWRLIVLCLGSWKTFLIHYQITVLNQDRKSRFVLEIRDLLLNIVISRLFLHLPLDLRVNLTIIDTVTSGIKTDRFCIDSDVHCPCMEKILRFCPSKIVISRLGRRVILICPLHYILDWHQGIQSCATRTRHIVKHLLN